MCFGRLCLYLHWFMQLLDALSPRILGFSARSLRAGIAAKWHCWVKEENNILRTIQMRKADWVGHILCAHCVVNRVIGGKKEGRIEVRGRRRSLSERKWSVDKCSEVELRVVGWSVVKCSEGLSNRVSNIIRRYIGHVKFSVL